MYGEILNSKNSILLRINDKEKEQKVKEINDSFLSLVYEIHNDFESANFGDAEEKIEDLIKQSRELLKYEWDRARDGEKSFRVAKKTALVTVVLSVMFLVVVAALKIAPATTEVSETNTVNDVLEKLDSVDKQELNNFLNSPAPRSGTAGEPDAS